MARHAAGFDSSERPANGFSVPALRRPDQRVHVFAKILQSFPRGIRGGTIFAYLSVSAANPSASDRNRSQSLRPMAYAICCVRLRKLIINTAGSRKADCPLSGPGLIQKNPIAKSKQPMSRVIRNGPFPDAKPARRPRRRFRFEPGPRPCGAAAGQLANNTRVARLP